MRGRISNETWTTEQFREYCMTGKKPMKFAPEVAFKVNEPTKSARAPAGQMNKTEAEYHRILQARERVGELLHIFEHESIKFRIGDKRCWYTPDFAVIGRDGVLELHEVKGGRVWDDARVKFQAAKLNYKHFRWYWCQKKDGVWKESV